MKMNQYPCNDYSVVAIEGEFDAKAVEDCRQDLQNLAGSAEKGLVFDLSDVSFMDSSGIGALVFLFKRLSAQKRSMHLIGLTGQPARLVNLLRINQTIATHDSIKAFMSIH